MSERKSFDQLSSLILRSVGDGVYGIDKNGRTTFSNAAAETMTGWTEQEILGQISHNVLHHTKADGCHYPVEECPIYAAIHDGSVHQVDHELFWRKDGTPFPVEYTSTPMIDNGEIVGAVVVFRDITARKMAEASVKKAHEELRRLKDQLQADKETLEIQLKQATDERRVVGQSPALQAVLEQVAQVAPTDANVLIYGESGTGKELIARAVHMQSPRHNKPMLKLNCGALCEGTVDSELFGHEKGAFTGAAQMRKGRFELAQGGTLFLDEVAELPLDTQTKLLRVLQEREFERVGGSHTIEANVRVIAATHKDLVEECHKGNFRQDLYYRLNVFPLALPALRERISDIPLLVETYLSSLALRLGRQLGPLNPQSLQRVMAYPWYGNIRELQNVLERAAILAKPNTPIDVPESFLTGLPAQQEQLEQAPQPALNGSSAASPLSLVELEKQHILAVLEQTHWQISGDCGAAALLDINPNTLRSRMDKHGIRKQG